MRSEQKAEGMCCVVKAAKTNSESGVLIPFLFRAKTHKRKEEREKGRKKK